MRPHKGPSRKVTGYDPVEALFGEGFQRRHDDGVVQIDGNVDVARPVVSVLRRGPRDVNQPFR